MAKVEVPGGDQVRISYSSGVSLDFGKIKHDVSYSANVDAADVEAMMPKIKKWVRNEVKTALGE